MRRGSVAVCVLLLIFFQAGWAKDLAIKPTTTLHAQTSNNTSAANSFPAQSNGNARSSNISKLDIHSLLYPGARTRLYAHLLLWFGDSKHMNVGYSSSDSTQVKRQIQDMISRGIEGVLIDWHGPATPSDQATRQVKREAELHAGFSFAVIVDVGAIKWDSCAGCSSQQALTQQLQYVEQNYIGSPAYMRLEGRPVLSNFDVDPSYQIDWQAARNSLASDPVFLFQNSGGFTHAITAGSYSWVMPSTSDFGVSYLDNFYRTGQSHSSLQTVGAVYKGFNDTLASWGSNRIMTQQCGQTWLRTFSTINQLYDSGKPLDALQLVTWNDYEEGTELESGIDNCVSISAKVSGNELKWTMTGKENTIDHYQVYISKDGQNLMPLTEMATGLRSLNLCSFSLPSANYKLFVKAVGRPSMTNHISPSVSYKPGCNAAIAGQAILLQATPSSLKIGQGTSANTTVSVTSESGGLDVPVSLDCSNLPVGLSCDFSPSAIAVGPGGASSILSVFVAPVSTSFRRGKKQQGVLYACLLGFGMVGFVGLGNVGRKQRVRIGLIVLLACCSVLLSSCGGGGQGIVRPGSSYVINIVGTSGGAQMSTSLSIRIE